MFLIDDDDEEIRSNDESKTSSHQYRYIDQEKKEHSSIFSFTRD